MTDLEVKFNNLSKMAAEGNLESICDLGDCYENGKGCSPDPLKAVECYLGASNAGSATGKYLLGRCHEKGVGVTACIEKALELYDEAASMGNPEAEQALCEYYLAVPGRIRSYPYKNPNGWLFVCLSRIWGNGDHSTKNRIMSCVAAMDDLEMLKKAANVFHDFKCEGDYSELLGFCFFRIAVLTKCVYGFDKAVLAFEKAISYGSQKARVLYAESLLEKGRQAEARHDMLTAESVYVKASYFDCHEALRRRAIILERNGGYVNNINEMTSLFKKAVDNGSRPAIIDLVACNLAFGLDVCVPCFKSGEILGILKEYATDNDARTLRNLGICREFGYGEAPNLEQALEFYAKAAEKGDILARFMLGVHSRLDGNKDDNLKLLKEVVSSCNYWHGHLICEMMQLYLENRNISGLPLVKEIYSTVVNHNGSSQSAKLKAYLPKAYEYIRSYNPYEHPSYFNVLEEYDDDEYEYEWQEMCNDCNSDITEDYYDNGVSDYDGSTESYMDYVDYFNSGNYE